MLPRRPVQLGCGWGEPRGNRGGGRRRAPGPAPCRRPRRGAGQDLGDAVEHGHQWRDLRRHRGGWCDRDAARLAELEKRGGAGERIWRADDLGIEEGEQGLDDPAGWCRLIGGVAGRGARRGGACPSRRRLSEPHAEEPEGADRRRRGHQVLRGVIVQGLPRAQGGGCWGAAQHGGWQRDEQGGPGGPGGHRPAGAAPLRWQRRGQGARRGDAVELVGQRQEPRDDHRAERHPPALGAAPLRRARRAGEGRRRVGDVVHQEH
mmetsp:Transcript_6103/g.18085  ORF Transcript_6103/g.18085 Transcript_6103/m.18085 type:complete len:262 (+) Transcript_6103:786-1571(+)